MAVLAPPHPSCAKQVCLPLTTPPSHCSTQWGAGSTAEGGLTLLWEGGPKHGLGGWMLPPAVPHPTLLPALFLFFKLMLLWVLSCLYENKNNPKASIHTQPLPEALTALGTTPPPTDRQETPGVAACPWGRYRTPSTPRRDLGLRRAAWSCPHCDLGLQRHPGAGVPPNPCQHVLFLDPLSYFWCQHAARAGLLVATPAPPLLPIQAAAGKVAGMGRSCPKSSWAVLWNILGCRSVHPALLQRAEAPVQLGAGESVHQLHPADVGEGAGVHAVNVQDPIQMVHLVLHDAGGPAHRLPAHRLPALVHPCGPERGGNGGGR